MVKRATGWQVDNCSATYLALRTFSFREFWPQYIDKQTIPKCNAHAIRFLYPDSNFEYDDDYVMD